MFHFKGKSSLSITVTVSPSHFKASPPVRLGLLASAVVRVGLPTVVVPLPPLSSSSWPSVILVMVIMSSI